MDVDVGTDVCTKHATSLGGAWWLAREASFLLLLRRSQHIVRLIATPANAYGYYDVVLERLYPFKHLTGHVVREVISGLQYMHALCVIHADINPSNIMMSKAGRVKFIDFNLSLFALSAASGAGTGASASGSLACSLLTDFVQAQGVIRRPR